MKNPKRGGARKGAGRKKTTERMNLFLKFATADKLRALKKRDGVTLGQVVDRLADQS